MENMGLKFSKVLFLILIYPTRFAQKNPKTVTSQQSTRFAFKNKA